MLRRGLATTEWRVNPPLPEHRTPIQGPFTQPPTLCLSMDRAWKCETPLHLQDSSPEMGSNLASHRTAIGQPRMKCAKLLY